MNRRTLLILTTLTAATAGLTLGCTPTNEGVDTQTEDTVEQTTSLLTDSIDEEEWDNWLANYKEVEGMDEAPSPTPTAATTASAPQPKDKGATKALPSGKKIYISTYGAQGQVWGHVVMDGTSGRGTIHDANENTLSVRVTRHGNELFGIDQNGREYVFKI